MNIEQIKMSPAREGFKHKNSQPNLVHVFVSRPKRKWATSGLERQNSLHCYVILEACFMKQDGVDFVIVIDELKREGQTKISPISREANSFDCPKCGSLISPDNPNSYSEFGYDKNSGALIECKSCKATIKLSWQTEPHRSICKQFSRPA